ncbi:MAG: deoxyribodipyrimidine photo-lyase [Ahniella sp.]|nr:deoxyribodipyrimidine photo-lyase [Ahniella sp.]
MSTRSPHIVWFRRDLRVRDNPALTAACADGGPVLAVYVHSPRDAGPWGPGGASRWWLHHSLAALTSDLNRLGIPLLLLRGPTRSALLSLCSRVQARAVSWNRRYEPGSIEVDKRLKAQLAAQGVVAQSFNGSLLIEPWQITTGVGSPYRVFTPFWRKAQTLVQAEPGLPAPEPRRNHFVVDAPGLTLESLKLLPRIPWAGGLAATWQPGEAGAHSRLERFLVESIQGYREGRDYPQKQSTSGLSPHLAFGEVSPRQVLAAVHAHWNSGMGLTPDADFFVRELFWREFSYHLLFHFPNTPTENLNADFDTFAWRQPDPVLLKAWQQGRTGLPIVDAGMRELWKTGTMHNRVRMLVASVLTKNLRYHWLHGARWFWDTLVDADLANNTQGWQWTAGTGADAAPYFRIFNPVTQGERFDPEGGYVRRFVPELAEVPTRFIHQPWLLPPAEQARLGLAGTPYVRPLIDLASSRTEALAAYKTRGD